MSIGDVRAGNLPDTLKAISLLGDVIGILERKWERPHSEFETAVIQSLSVVCEVVRRAHVERPPYPTIMDCIEAGLAGDEQRCREYANLLLSKLQETHQARSAERLGRILRSEHGQQIGLAQEDEVSHFDDPSC